MELIPDANKPLGIKKHSFLKKKKCNGLKFNQHIAKMLFFFISIKNGVDIDVL